MRDISAKKNEPEWMLDVRLKALRTFDKKPMPNWANLEGIDFDNIKYFVRSTENRRRRGRNCRRTSSALTTASAFRRPKKQRLVAGVAAQYESEVVYHQITQDRGTRLSSRHRFRPQGIPGDLQEAFRNRDPGG